MSETFRRNISRLKKLDGVELYSASQQVSEILSTGEGKNLSGVAYTLLRIVDAKHPNWQVQKFLDEEFLDLAVREYTDVDGLRKVAVGVSILQDYKNVDENLEKNLAEALQLEITKRKWQYVFNDISVNTIQLRTSYPKW